MSEQNYSIDQDLKEAESMANGLEAYLLSNDIYGKSGGFFDRTPSLTIGALLMRLRRLNALRDQMTESQRRTLENATAKHAQIQREWTLHYNEKAVREAHSRLDAMKHFFEECRENPRLCASGYPTEMLRRTIVQEIAEILDTQSTDSKDLPARMASADSSLRRYAQPANAFQWDAILQPAYPQDTYWWLYAKPSQTGK